MTATQDVIIRPTNETAIGLFPVMVGLFVFASALKVNVGMAPALLLLVLTAAGVWSNTRVLEGSRYSTLYGLLLAAKLGLLTYQVRYRNLPLGGVDWQFYDRFGSQLAVETGGDLLAILTSSDWDLFTRSTAIIYSVFGADSAQMYFLVFVTSLVAFTYVFGAARILLRDRRQAQRVALLYMVWPHQVVMSVTFLREMPIQMLVAASLYHFLRFWHERHAIHLLVAVAASLVATLMHSGMIVLLIVYTYLAIRDRDRKGLQPLRTAGFIIGMIFLLRTPFAAPLLAKFGDVNAAALIEAGSGLGTASADATTYYLSHDMNTVPLLQLPYRLAMFTLSPLPWQASNMGTAVAVLIEGLPRMFVVVMLAMCYFRCRTGEPRHDTLILGLLLTLVAGYVVFALGVSTYGSAIRHRAKFFPIEIILAYATYLTLHGRRRLPTCAMPFHGSTTGEVIGL